MTRERFEYWKFPLIGGTILTAIAMHLTNTATAALAPKVAEFYHTVIVPLCSG